MSKKVRFTLSTKIQSFCTFLCVDQRNREIERPRAKAALSIAEFDKYCYLPEHKEGDVKEKPEKRRPRIRQSLTKQRRTRNRFATKDKRKSGTSRNILAPDFADLIIKTRDETKDLPSRNGHPVQGTRTELDVHQSALHPKERKDSRKSGKWTKPSRTAPMKHRKNGSLLTETRNGKWTTDKPGEISEDTTPRHRRLGMQTHAKAQTQTAMGGKNRVQHRNAVETMLERPNKLRIVPLAESNIRVENKNRVSIRAEPGIEYNIFYLLSSVQKNGLPWRIRSLEDARGILTSSQVTISMSEYILKQKLLDLTMARDFPGFVEKEYSAYRECKFRTLHFVGYYSMKKYMKAHEERHASGRLFYQSLKWENNSCALDAFIFVLPQICGSVISKGMYRSKLAGSDPCFHSSVACIFAALEAVQSEDMELALASNWTRHLFMNIVQYIMPQHDMHDSQASWSSFVRPQGYLDISSILFYLPKLLGQDSPSFQNVQVPLVLEVSTFFTRATFENSRQQKDFKILAAFLFASIVLAAQTAKQQVSESIYLFALTFPEENPSFSMFERWLQKLFLTSWDYESNRNEPNLGLYTAGDLSNSDRTWRLETLALIGRSSTTADHFVALSNSSTSQDSVWFYDGLKENGRAERLPKREAMSLSNSKVEMEGLFVLSVLNLLE